MANFGVNLEEVWHMSSLLPPQQTTSKHSKYEVDVGNRGAPGGGRGGDFAGGPGAPGGGRGGDFAGGAGGPGGPGGQQSYQPTAVIQDNFIPISNQQVPPRRLVETMDMPSVPSSNNNSDSQSGGPAPLPDFVIDYQKEIQYLRALTTTLKRELTQKQQKEHAAEKKKQRNNIMILIGFAILLIIIIVMLSQVIQKMNRLISQPMLFNV
jgi:hypothetical protein